MGLLARLGNWLAPKPDGEVGRPDRGTVYMRDTRAGHIASRPTILREHRDEIRIAWDRSAGLALDLIHNSGRLKGACDQILADTVGNELTCNPQPDLTGLGVWSRHLMVRIEFKPSRLCCPDFADVFVGR